MTSRPAPPVAVIRPCGGIKELLQSLYDAGVTDDEAGALLAAAFWDAGPLPDEGEVSPEEGGTEVSLPAGNATQEVEAVNDPFVLRVNDQENDVDDSWRLELRAVVRRTVERGLEAAIGPGGPGSEVPHDTSLADLGLDSLDLLKLATYADEKGGRCEWTRAWALGLQRFAAAIGQQSIIHHNSISIFSLPWQCSG